MPLPHTVIINHIQSSLIRRTRDPEAEPAKWLFCLVTGPARLCLHLKRTWEYEARAQSPASFNCLVEMLLLISLATQSIYLLKAPLEY